MGLFLAIVDPIVGKARLTKVLMDGGSGLNVLYTDTLDHMGISRKDLCPSGAPFFEIILYWSIWLPVTFGDLTNFRKEYLDFEVVDFASPYHALLGRPCYTKFMTVSYYGCLKLNIPGPWVVIVVASSMAEAYHYEQEGTALTTVDVVAANFTQIRRQPGDEPPKGSKGNVTTTFHPADDTKMIQIRLEDPEKRLCIGAGMSPNMESTLTEFLCNNADVFA
ncbi:uncharacterized protein [Miscanthus floridulus]|uniref:uncharacterized protein n=1 Tax=Miscanthus floridulus TaxID=154761 RepID=UPI003458D7CC